LWYRRISKCLISQRIPSLYYPSHSHYWQYLNLTWQYICQLLWIYKLFIYNLWWYIWHLPILVNTNLKPAQTLPSPSVLVQSRTYKSANFDNFYTKLKSTIWTYFIDCCASQNNPDIVFNEFHSLFFTLFDESFWLEARPTFIKNSTNKIHQPWILWLNPSQEITAS